MYICGDIAGCRLGDFVLVVHNYYKMLIPMTDFKDSFPGKLIYDAVSNQGQYMFYSNDFYVFRDNIINSQNPTIIARENYVIYDFMEEYITCRNPYKFTYVKKLIRSEQDLHQAVYINSLFTDSLDMPAYHDNGITKEFSIYLLEDVAKIKTGPSSCLTYYKKSGHYSMSKELPTVLESSPNFWSADLDSGRITCNGVGINLNNLSTFTVSMSGEVKRYMLDLVLKGWVK